MKVNISLSEPLTAGGRGLTQLAHTDTVCASISHLNLPAWQQRQRGLLCESESGLLYNIAKR